MVAAEHGLGVTFGVFPLATHYVHDGPLVVPLPDRVVLPGQFSFVYRPMHASRYPFAEISAWLRSEYAALPALEPGRSERDRAHRRGVSTLAARAAIVILRDLVYDAQQSDNQICPRVARAEGATSVRTRSPRQH